MSAGMIFPETKNLPLLKRNDSGSLGKYGTGSDRKAELSLSDGGGMINRGENRCNGWSTAFCATSKKLRRGWWVAPGEKRKPTESIMDTLLSG